MKIDRIVANRYKNKNKKIAKEVVHGKIEPGKNKSKFIEKAGYDYDAVNERVNTILRHNMDKTIHDIAQEVVEGKWGEGEICKKLLNEAGYNYNDVLREIQRLDK